mgnify:CR=1 FL=1
MVRNPTIRVGQGTIVPLEGLSPEEVLSEHTLWFSGHLSMTPSSAATLELCRVSRSGAISTVLIKPERHQIGAELILTNGPNEFFVRLTDPDGVKEISPRYRLFYKSSFREWNETVFIAFVLALIIRSLVVQAFWIPTGSMQPTLLGEMQDPVTRQRTQSGDRILVNKFAYVADLSLDGRLKWLPKLWLRFPKRGDIVVFKYPDPDPKAAPRDFIKRVIGLPGDRIRIIEGTVFVNDTALEEPYIAEPPWQDMETTVPLDSLFVLGDNRNNSADSRYWGPMPLANLKGQAVFLYWPFKRIGPIRSYSHPLQVRKSGDPATFEFPGPFAPVQPRATPSRGAEDGEPSSSDQ